MRFPLQVDPSIAVGVWEKLGADIGPLPALVIVALMVVIGVMLWQRGKQFDRHEAEKKALHDKIEELQDKRLTEALTGRDQLAEGTRALGEAVSFIKEAR